jgi:hypothetical protein
MSIQEGGKSHSTREGLKNINEWIGSASDEASRAFNVAWGKSPKISEHIDKFVTAHEHLSAIHDHSPELADSMSVRYVDYGDLATRFNVGTLASSVDMQLRNLGKDAIHYVGHMWEYMRAPSDTRLRVYRDPGSPARFLTISDYLNSRAGQNESGVGLMLVQTRETTQFAIAGDRTPDELTKFGTGRVTLSEEHDLPIDDLGLIEWLSLISQPSNLEDYKPPRLQGSWLLANRAATASSIEVRGGDVPFAVCSEAGRNIIGFVQPDLRHINAVRPAIVIL